MIPFDLQGHRGARGLKPENTLPGFEAALDLQVTSVETDLHLTRDGHVVLLHDPVVSLKRYRLPPSALVQAPVGNLPVAGLTLAQLRLYLADINPEPQRFPTQSADVTPVALLYAEQKGLHPYAPPTLADLFAFVDAYSGGLGAAVGKTEAQRQAARRLRFDLELKRVPFCPELIGDRFEGNGPKLFEQMVLEAVRQAGAVERTGVRSFDHRCVKALKRLEPRLTGAVLIAETAPVDPVKLVKDADAEVYCPDYHFLDQAQVRQLRVAGVRVVPWTVNELADCEKLLDWGVDGLTTDYPDRVATLLQVRGLRAP